MTVKLPGIKDQTLFPNKPKILMSQTHITTKYLYDYVTIGESFTSTELYDQIMASDMCAKNNWEPPTLEGVAAALSLTVKKCAKSGGKELTSVQGNAKGGKSYTYTLNEDIEVADLRLSNTGPRPGRKTGASLTSRAEGSYDGPTAPKVDALKGNGGIEQIRRMIDKAGPMPTDVDYIEAINDHLEGLREKVTALVRDHKHIDTYSEEELVAALQRKYASKK